MVMNAYAFPGLKRDLMVHIEHLEAKEIINIVCQYFDCDYDVIKSKSRLRCNVYSRSFCIYLLREHTILSLKEIGKFFNRDHTTVIHSIDKVKSNLMDNGYTLHERYLRDYGKLLIQINILKKINEQ